MCTCRLVCIRCKVIRSFDGICLIKVAECIFILYRGWIVTYYTSVKSKSCITSQFFARCAVSFRIFQFCKICLEYRSIVKCLICTIIGYFKTFVCSIFRILYYSHCTGVSITTGCKACPCCTHCIAFEIFYNSTFSRIRCSCRSRCLIALKLNNIYFYNSFFTASVSCPCDDIGFTNFTRDNGCFRTVSNYFKDRSFVCGPFQRFTGCFLRRNRSFYHHVTTVHNGKSVLYGFQFVRIFRINFRFLSILFYNLVVST